MKGNFVVYSSQKSILLQVVSMHQQYFNVAWETVVGGSPKAQTLKYCLYLKILILMILRFLSGSPSLKTLCLFSCVLLYFLDQPCANIKIQVAHGMGCGISWLHMKRNAYFHRSLVLIFWITSLGLLQKPKKN